MHYQLKLQFFIENYNLSMISYINTFFICSSHVVSVTYQPFANIIQLMQIVLYFLPFVFFNFLSPCQIYIYIYMGLSRLGGQQINHQIYLNLVLIFLDINYYLVIEKNVMQIFQL